MDLTHRVGRLTNTPGKVFFTSRKNCVKRPGILSSLHVKADRVDLLKKKIRFMFAHIESHTTRKQTEPPQGGRKSTCPRALQPACGPLTPTQRSTSFVSAHDRSRNQGRHQIRHASSRAGSILGKTKRVAAVNSTTLNTIDCLASHGSHKIS